MVEVWKQQMLVQQQEKEEMLKAEHMADGLSTSSDSSTEGEDMTGTTIFSSFFYCYYYLL
jgi:hypothetical protein